MATEHGGKVVVKTTLSFESHKDGRMVAARLTTLGLTAYGYTREEARDSVKGLFHKWVGLLRGMGLLEKRLHDMGVEWWRYDDYDGSLPVEDATAEAGSSAAPNVPMGEFTPMAVAA